MTRSVAVASLRFFLAAFFIVAGANHFLNPSLYLGMMPGWVPAQSLVNKMSGSAEILGGIGLLIPAVRVPAAWGLIALLVAVYPANLYATALGHMPGLPFSSLTLWLRLPFQAVFVFGIWWVALRSPKVPRKATAAVSELP